MTAAMLAAQPTVAWEASDFARSVCDAGPNEPFQIVIDDTAVDRTLPRRNRQHIPGPYVDWAERLLPPGEAPNPKTRREALNALQMFVLETHPKLVALNRAYLVDHGAGTALLQTFDQAVGWLADVCAAPPRQAYDLSTKTAEFATRDFVGLLKVTLLGLAMSRDVPEARFDWAMKSFHPPNMDERFGRSLLRKLGAEGYRPALRELVRRISKGDGFEPDRAETFFWMVKAQEAGLDFENELQTLVPQLDSKDQAHLAAWLKSGRGPEPWE